MNEVEVKTWNAIRETMLVIDPQHDGWFIDVGIGDSDYYFEWAHNFGYRALAVEPLPSPAVVESCQQRGVPLFEGVLAASNGTARLYRNSWINSLTPQLWDDMAFLCEVPSLSYLLLVERHELERVTALKLDVEGAEWSVISQLEKTDVLPGIISFEFGGVLERRERRGAWSQAAVDNTMRCVKTLWELDYNVGIKIEATSTGLGISPVNPVAGIRFEDNAVWGNIISMRKQFVNLAAFAERELRFAP